MFLGNEDRWHRMAYAWTSKLSQPKKEKEAAHKLPTGNNSWNSPTPVPCLGTVLDSAGHGLKLHQGTL